jgi:hydroxyacyl-ACP dehydratase HTD2-like protein with hotdog domain
MTVNSTHHAVSRSGVRRFALATGARNEIHHDPDYARALGYRDIVAPPGYFTAIALSLGRELPSSQLRHDGLAATDQLDGRVMAGGFVARWHAALCAGDEITAREEHLPPRTVTGRSGQLTIHTVHRSYFVGEQLAIEERSDRIGIPLARSAAPQEAARSADIREFISARLMLNELDLFMFSASTWLTHRIHFDREYARSEGYDDLVIPGPMQGACLAQLLVDFARAHGGKLESLELRHKSPAVCGVPLQMSASLLRTEHGEYSVSADLGVRIVSQTGVLHSSGRASLTLSQSEAVSGLLREYSSV